MNKSPSGKAASVHCGLTIGKLGTHAGVKVPTIRCYEQIGLLPEAERSAGNQRLYCRKARQAELERMVLQCAGGSIADCRVIKVLGDHSLCATDHRHAAHEAAA